MTTPLLAELIAHIRANGPLRLDHYWQLCTQHPEHGYYVQATPIGSNGDFITAPEVSQSFGEMVGLWALRQWQKLGKPAPFTLVELGPGRGVLLADMLRLLNKIDPAFGRSMQLMLVETSQPLRQQQTNRLQHFQPRWLEHSDALPQQPTLLLANEFFDALPVRQLVGQGEHWAEMHVGLTTPHHDDTPSLALQLAPPDPALAMLVRDSSPQLGRIREISPARQQAMAEWAKAISVRGGALLVIDYGYRTPPDTSTLKAYRQHQRADFMSAPGQTDLTSLVDFAELQAALRAPLTLAPLVTQASWLRRQGIEWRAAQLAATESETAFKVSLGVQKLLDAKYFGEKFLVLQASAPIPSPS